MVQHVQEVMALSLDLQTAISDHFPTKVTLERVNGIRQVRFMLCANWQKQEVFFRLCQTYCGKFISHSRNAADNQSDDNLNSSNTALLAIATSARQQVLQIRADHRSVVTELDDEAKRILPKLRGSELPGQYPIFTDNGWCLLIQPLISRRIAGLYHQEDSRTGPERCPGGSTGDLCMPSRSGHLLAPPYGHAPGCSGKPWQQFLFFRLHRRLDPFRKGSS